MTDPHESQELPSSLVPRWLAALVLVLLLGAGAHAAWWVFTGGSTTASKPHPGVEPIP